MRGPMTVSEDPANGHLPEGSLMPQAGFGGGRGGRGGGGGGGRGARGAVAPGANPGAAAQQAGRQGAPGATGIAGDTLPPDVLAAFAGRGGAPQPQWQPNIGGCESGFTMPDPTDADVVYASCYGNKVTRWDAKTGTARSIEPWMVTLDSPPNEVKYRTHWTAPMA